MRGIDAIDATRISSLASGRGGVPEGPEWIVVLALVGLLGIVGSRILVSAGLTRLEAGLVTFVAPFCVLLDAPLGSVGPGVSVAANVAGAVLPFLVALKILAEGRLPPLEVVFLIVLGTFVAFIASDVVPARGVLLHYRLPALAVGLAAAALFVHSPLRAGAAAYVGGSVGVVIGADLLNLGTLAASGGARRIILGGAGILDGIYLVAFLAAAVAGATVLALRWALTLRSPARAPG